MSLNSTVVRQDADTEPTQPVRCVQVPEPASLPTLTYLEIPSPALVTIYGQRQAGNQSSPGMTLESPHCPNDKDCGKLAVPGHGFYEASDQASSGHPGPEVIKTFLDFLPLGRLTMLHTDSQKKRKRRLLEIGIDDRVSEKYGQVLPSTYPGARFGGPLLPPRTRHQEQHEGRKLLDGRSWHGSFLTSSHPYLPYSRYLLLMSSVESHSPL